MSDLGPAINWTALRLGALVAAHRSEQIEAVSIIDGEEDRMLTCPPSGTAPSESARPPKATMRAMALQAMETSRISALSSPLAPGKRRRCSIRY